MEDIALVHYAYWGKHLEGISAEQAEQVVFTAKAYKVDFNS